jgi:hypothetical protein
MVPRVLRLTTHSFEAEVKKILLSQDFKVKIAKPPDVNACPLCPQHDDLQVVHAMAMHLT